MLTQWGKLRPTMYSPYAVDLPPTVHCIIACIPGYRPEHDDVHLRTYVP
jgi:hypothetical protein